MGRTKPQSVSPDYVVGLTDGEGCFYVQVRKFSIIQNRQSGAVTLQGDILRKIVPFFRTHPLLTVSKKKNFGLFCRIAQLVEKKRHLTKTGIVRIEKLKRQMNQRSGLA